MKTKIKFFASIVSILFIICCTTPKIVEVTPTLSKDSTKVEIKQNLLKEILENLDYKFFYQTALKIELPEKIKSNISADDYIIICPGDIVLDNNKSLQVIIKQAIIKNCLNLKYKILERDSIPLLRTLSENNLNFKGIFPYYKEGSYFPYETKPQVNNNIYSANKILSYQILDAGIKKISYTQDKVTRLGYIYISFKVIDVKTSQILSNELLEVSNQDEITDKLNTSIEKFKLYNTRFPFPLISLFIQTPTIETSSLDVKTSFSNKNEMNIKVTLGSYKYKVRILNQNNSEVYSFDVPNLASQTISEITYKWNTSNLPAGTYIINLSKQKDNNIIFSQKVIVIE